MSRVLVSPAAYEGKATPLPTPIAPCSSPDEVPDASFGRRRRKGAFLLLPFNAHREDAIRTKVFETYMSKYCDSWLETAILGGFDVKLEDIIFVTGCDLVSSWAIATFTNLRDVKISLSGLPAELASAGFNSFQWSTHLVRRYK